MAKLPFSFVHEIKQLVGKVSNLKEALILEKFSDVIVMVKDYNYTDLRVKLMEPGVLQPETEVLFSGPSPTGHPRIRSHCEVLWISDVAVNRRRGVCAGREGNSQSSVRASYGATAPHGRPRMRCVRTPHP